MNVIGKGSYCRVYSNCDDAIKVFKDKFSQHSIREIALITFLDSPYIIKAKKIELKSPGIWQVYMKKYDFDLSSVKWFHWANQRIDRFLLTCSQILSAVVYLHDNKVIHGDIKPENILFDLTQERSVLCDFNVSIVEPKLYNSSIVQTAHYRAPEVNLESRLSRYDYKIDVWSLGCLFYELLTRETLMKFLSEDSTVGACRFFGIPGEATRKERLERLRGVSFNYARKCVSIALDNPVHEAKSWLFYSPQSKDNFFSDLAGVIAKCIRVRASERATSRSILRILNDMLVACGNKPQAETPICRPPASPVECIDNEIRELSVVAQTFNNREKKMIKLLLKVEANLIKEGEKRLLKATRLLELEYYGKIESKKILGSADALLTTCACYYLMACIYSRKEHAEELLKFLIKKRLREKCEEIMEVVDYELILE